MNPIQTSFHEAAKKGALQEVKALLNRDPDPVFSKDEEGDTPLHCVAFAAEWRKLLLEMTV